MIFNHMSFLRSKGDSMVKVWKDADEVIKSTIEIKEEYKEIKKIMEEAPNGVNIKPKSKFRKDTRIEKY